MSNLEETLFNISLKTFEELAFLMPMPEENPQAENCDLIMTCVEYQGYSEGILYITISDFLLPVLAQNILAEDDISKDQQLDALKEIANVICGNILPALAGADKKHRLLTPQIVEKIDEKYKNPPFGCTESIYFFDEGTAKLYWYFEQSKKG